MKLLTTCILTFWTMILWSQGSEVLSTIHYSDQKSGMIVLGTWGISNAIIGSVGSLRSTHLEVKSFHQMNLGWGIINAGIASLGYYSALKGGTIPLESMSLLQENQSLKSILLLNTGLDVAYMISGVYLIEKDKNSIKNPGRLRGFGKSLIMQGAFLFVFDLGMYINFNSQTKDIIKLFSQNGAIGLSYTF